MNNQKLTIKRCCCNRVVKMNQGKNNPTEKPVLRCGEHSKLVDLDGFCADCKPEQSQFPEISKYHRIRRAIKESARHYNCDWRQIENAVQQAETVGLSFEDIDAQIESSRFSDQPIIKLSQAERQSILKLKAAGLRVWRRKGGPFKHGFTITKPISTKGNTRPDHNGGHYITLTDEEALENPDADLDEDSELDEHGNDTWDAPVGLLVPTPQGNWNFMVSIFSGGRTPVLGDFQNQHATLADAVEDILDYYFGDPARMLPQDLLDRIAKYPKH